LLKQVRHSKKWLECGKQGGQTHAKYPRAGGMFGLVGGEGLNVP